MINRLLFLCCIVMLGGCTVTQSISNYISGGDDNAEPPAPLVEFKQRLNVIKLWSRNTGSGAGKQYLKLAPIIANQQLYIASSDGDLSAIDATNGQAVWSFDTDINITGGPGFGENTILVGNDEGEVVSYAADSGKEIWRAKVSSEILSAPQRAEGIVIVRTLDGKLFALDGDNGKRLWIYDRTVPSLTLRGTSTPIINNGVVIAGFDGGRLAALELRTGRLMWEARITTAKGRSELDRMVDIDSEPLIIEGVIYVVSFQGNMAAVQLETGRILWTRDISSYAGFGADEKYIYVTDDSSHIWAFDRFSGNTMWKQEKLQSRTITAPASIGDYIVVGDFEGYLHWMSKSSGNFVARTNLSNKRIIVAPVVVGKVLYAVGSSGKLVAYSYR
ncbi:MAG: outer membrane protein assembly factor BamB [Gammaproteobacteria bacterium]|nr:outer membrane protein assembly factor BamB [Gammaproteobacteria bacterium]